jgi:hypothetical protein
LSDKSLQKLRNMRENCKLTYGSLAKITARRVTVVTFGSLGQSREYEPALFRNGLLRSLTIHLVFDLSF